MAPISRLATAAAALALAPPALAQTEDPALSILEEAVQEYSLDSRTADAVAVLKGEAPAEDVFAATFLSEVSAEQLAELTTQMEGQFGPLQGVESVTQTGEYSADIAIRFEKAIGHGKIQLAPDGDHRVVGLFISSFDRIGDSVEDIVAELEALPGVVSVLYTPLDGWASPVIALNAERQMAIGSTFKLYVLSALARSITLGEHDWDEVVRLNVQSLPSGKMHDWPAQSPVTLATLATMMIADSDNTATDQLIAILGRERIAEEVRLSGHSGPDRMLPFLNTLELFALKGDPALGEAYLAAGEDSEEAQATYLDEMAAAIAGNPDNITKPTFASPHAIDTIEWFASAQDIRAIMEQLKEMPEPGARRIMAINPALSDDMAERWAYVGYKGGSEPGVLNLSWLLQTRASEWYVLTMSWNDPDAPVDDAAFVQLANRILALQSN